MGISREGWGLRDGTLPNKKKHLQTRKNTNKQEKNTNKQEKNTSKQEKNTNKQEKTPPNKKKNTNKQEKHLSSKGYLPIKCKSLQVVGVSGQGKAVASDGG